MLTCFNLAGGDYFPEEKNGKFVSDRALKSGGRYELWKPFIAEKFVSRAETTLLKGSRVKVNGYYEKEMAGKLLVTTGGRGYIVDKREFMMAAMICEELIAIIRCAPKEGGEAIQAE